MAEFDKLNEFINKKFGHLFRKMSYDSADPKRKFPNGFKWRYINAGRATGYQEFWFCWSLTRNANNKFISWIYKWQGKAKHRTAGFDSIVEHKRKKSAKERALRMHKYRLDELAKKEVVTVQKEIT